jgi:hypothetical protein
MSKRFQSKSGLPEALGSTAHQHVSNNGEGVHYPSKAMCDIPGCKTRRIGMETLPSGERVPVYGQGRGDVVIRTEDSVRHGYVCQEHYLKIITAAGKDQLTVAARNEERIAQPDLNAPAPRPSGLIDHLNEIERTVLAKADDLHNAERWQSEREEAERIRQLDDEQADRWADEHGD